MSMDLDQAPAEVLNDLIQTCIDGQKGFEAASKAIDDPAIRDELVGYSWQRQQFATELKSRLQAFGEKPSEHGSTTAALHRGWMDVKSAVGAGREHSVLAECERGEDAAVDAYRKAMNTGMPEEYTRVVSTQFQTIQRTHDRIKALRDATEKKN